MKRLILIITFMFLLMPYHIFAQDICESDFTCDGDVDSADVSTFLEDFGRSPFFNPCPPCVPLIPVAKTGQTLCHDTDGNPRDCTGTGEDGEFQSGYDRFIDNGDETVTDSYTGLMWTKDTFQFPRMQMWQAALTSCNELDWANYTDWKLPSVSEAKSLIGGLPLDYHFLNEHEELWYWTSSTTFRFKQNAWEIELINGTVNSADKMLMNHVWCVRSGQITTTSTATP